MRLILKRMRLQNFKGIKDLVVEFGKDRTDIFATNGKGKTTIVDAFSWLFSGKDSEGKADFDIKTLDSNNNPIHGLHHEVECTLLEDGEELILRRAYMEDWTKHKGSEEAVLSGHTTNYYINEVPTQKKAYDIFTEGLASADQFKLLTNPLFFNDEKAFGWKKRRELLLSVCGDITDKDVIAGNKSLSGLLEILGKKSIEDLKAIVAAKKKEVNQELTAIPTRIDEASRTLEATAGVDAVSQESIQIKIDELKSNKSAVEKQVSDIRNDSAVAAKRVRLAEIDNEIMKLQNEHIKAEQEAKQVKQNQLNQESVKLSDIENKILTGRRNISQIESDIAIKKTKKSELLAQLKEVKKKEFVHNAECVCPTCGQGLQEEKLEAARVKALEDFNKLKSDTIESIMTTGTGMKAEIEEKQSKVEQIKSEEENLSAQKNSSQQLIDNIKTEILAIIVPDNSEKQNLLNDEKKKVEIEIVDIQQSKNDVIVQKIELAQKFESEIEGLRKHIAAIQQNEAMKVRIDQLKEQERKLSAEYSSLEKQTYLVEEFTKFKVNMIEQNINSKFKFARFKLFETQVNGSIADCCKTMFNGVTWNDLNSSSRIIIGLDICDTLAQHYGIYLPTFVDNAESIVVLPIIESQLCALYVSEADEVIRVVAE